MDPVVQRGFERVDSGFERLEKRVEEMDQRSVERWRELTQRADSEQEARRERDSAIDTRLASLEAYTSSQYTAAVVADNWGGHFEDRIANLERRTVDLELLRAVDRSDEQAERLEALETTTAELRLWKLRTEADIDDVHYDLCHIRRSGEFAPPHTGLPAWTGSSAMRPPAGFVDYRPNGHRPAAITRDPAYGSVTTIVPLPANA